MRILLIAILAFLPAMATAQDCTNQSWDAQLQTFHSQGHANRAPFVLPVFHVSTLSDSVFWRPFDAGTMGVQLALEVAGAGLFLGLAAAVLGDDDNLEVALPLALFAPLVLPGAAYYGGKTMGGNVTVGGALLGLLAGGIVPIVAGVLIGDASSTLFQAVCGVSLLAGPIVGYHLSASPVTIASADVCLRKRPPVLAGFTDGLRNTSTRQSDSSPVSPHPDISVRIVSIPF